MAPTQSKHLQQSHRSQRSGHLRYDLLSALQLAPNSLHVGPAEYALVPNCVWVPQADKVCLDAWIV